MALAAWIEWFGHQTAPGHNRESLTGQAVAGYGKGVVVESEVKQPLKMVAALQKYHFQPAGRVALLASTATQPQFRSWPTIASACSSETLQWLPEKVTTRLPFNNQCSENSFN